MKIYTHLYLYWQLRVNRRTIRLHISLEINTVFHIIRVNSHSHTSTFTYECCIWELSKFDGKFYSSFFSHAKLNYRIPIAAVPSVQCLGVISTARYWLCAPIISVEMEWIKVIHIKPHMKSLSYNLQYFMR